MSPTRTGSFRDHLTLFISRKRRRDPAHPAFCGCPSQPFASPFNGVAGPREGSKASLITYCQKSLKCDQGKQKKNRTRRERNRTRRFALAIFFKRFGIFLSLRLTSSERVAVFVFLIYLLCFRVQNVTGNPMIFTIYSFPFRRVQSKMGEYCNRISITKFAHW